MKKLLRNSILALLLVSTTSCSSSKPSNIVNNYMHRNTKGVFHIINTNVDLIPMYYYEYSTGYGCTLYMEDNYSSAIELSPGTYVFFRDGNCLICNHK